MQRAASERYSTPMASIDPIPPQPWNSRVLDPANNANDRSVFYSHVHSSVVAQTISNSLDARSLESLELEREKFTFYETNGYFVLFFRIKFMGRFLHPFLGSCERIDQQNWNCSAESMTKIGMKHIRSKS